MLDSQFTIGSALGLLVLFIIAGAVFMFGRPATEGAAKYVSSYFMSEEEIDKALGGAK